jgi:hypothetical protein
MVGPESRECQGKKGSFGELGSARMKKLHNQLEESVKSASLNIQSEATLITASKCPFVTELLL